MKNTTLFILALVPALALAGPVLDGHGHAPSHEPAVGIPGDPTSVSRTIEVRMGDNMRFTPDRIEVQRGEMVRFVVNNGGVLPHEFVLGTPDELREHAESMRRFPGMEHDDPNKVTVPPGEVRELVWRFATSGAVDFACLVPGHFEAGMAGKVIVSGEQTAMSEGVVKKLDRERSRVTIEHGPLENLGMPAMTMVFQVNDPAMLDGMQEGGRIRFVAGQVEGRITVMEVAPTGGADRHGH